MRLDALETEDMLTQRATNKKKREGDGDKEGLLLDQKRKQYFTLEYFTAIINQPMTLPAPLMCIYQWRTVISHYV